MKQYKGQLEGFPFEIVEKMLYYQEQQGNERDVTVFEDAPYSSFYIKGFTWKYTEEGEEFWGQVIIHKNFEIFFEKYPTKSITKDSFNQNKTNMNNRFPFKLSRKDGVRIINAACEDWRMRLAQEWVVLLFEDLVEVSEEFYRKMRRACTPDQHKLLDEIFGNDVDLSILNSEDVFYFKGKNNSEYLFKGEDLRTRVKALNTSYYDECFRDSGPFIIENIVELRKATPEEEKLYYKYYPEWSLKDAKDGEPVWVKSKGDYNWLLRYADGKGNTYAGQQKHGRVVQWVGETMKFDPNNLPVNK